MCLYLRAGLNKAIVTNHIKYFDIDIKFRIQNSHKVFHFLFVL